MKAKNQEVIAYHWMVSPRMKQMRKIVNYLYIKMDGRKKEELVGS